MMSRFTQCRISNLLPSLTTLLIQVMYITKFTAKRTEQATNSLLLARSGQVKRTSLTIFRNQRKMDVSVAILSRTACRT